MSTRFDLGVVTAYAYAVEGGYTGTEAEFTALLGNIALDLEQIENLSVTVETLPAGSSATASYADGVLSLGIPKGDKGDKGNTGATGPTGATPDISIGTVTTGAVGSDAAATMTGTPEHPVLNLTLPRGATGDVTNLADTFSSSKAYTAGEYVIYNDLLYVFTANHAAGAWNASHVSQVKVGGELTALKEDFNLSLNLLEDGSYTVTSSILTLQKGIDVNTGVETNLTGYDTWAASDYIPIIEGVNVIKSNAATGSNSYGYAFYDANKQFINGSGVGSYNNFIVYPQTNYKYIRFTSYNADGNHNSIYLTCFTDKSFNSIIDSLTVIGNEYLKVNNVLITLEKAIVAPNGNEISFPGYNTWGCSDFIPIPIGTYKVISNAESNSGYYGYAFYDENRQYISGSTAPYLNGLSVIVPNSARFLRFTDYRADGNHSGIYVKFDGNKYGFHNEESATLESVINDATILKGNYTLNSSIVLTKNQHIQGNQCVITVGSNGRIIMNKGTSISGVKFVGDWTPTRQSGDGITYPSAGYVPLISNNDLATGNSDAMFGTNKNTTNAVIYMQYDMSYNSEIENCIFENFDRLAIFAGGQRHQEKNNPIIHDNYFSDCRMGIYVEGEFARIYANEYLRCIIGCTLRGGNANNFGEIFKCCDCGYYYPYYDGNTAHNEIVSCEAAHCGIAGIYVRELRASLGSQITGCQFVDSPIIGLTVNNLSFVGCRIDTYIKYNNGKGNSFVCSNIGKSYLYSNALFDVPSDTLITLNRGLGNVQDSEVNTN